MLAALSHIKWDTKPSTNNPKHAVYQTHFSRCDKAYYDETGSGFDTRINEYQADAC